MNAIENLDPATLLVDTNVRTATELGKEFVASIRDYGVLVPIVAVSTAEGGIRVRYGHRRTLAAIEAGQASVPVLVTGQDDADDAARIVRQWAENEHRAGLSTVDKLAAVEQLALLGLSPAQIVKRTKTRKADVDQAIAASGSSVAKAAAARYGFLTLDQSAAVAEFESSPDVVKALIAAAQHNDGDFRHVLQRARDDREEAAQVAALREQLTTAGVPIIERPGYSEHSIKVLDELADEQGKTLTAGAHTDCPGHAAFIRNGVRVAAVYVCTKWKGAGHRDRHASNSRSTTPAPMDEAAKAERRQVIANNRAWQSAQTVRREWLASFLTRKTPPKGSAVYVAAELAGASYEQRKAMERGHELAANLLGLDPAKVGHGSRIGALPQATTDARAQVIALAVVLAAVEESTGPHTWRNTTDTTRRYFAFLTANGYQLADVEALCTATPKPPRRKSA